MTSQATELVNAVAEKIGVAAEKLAPIGEELIRQVQMRAFVWSITCVLVMLFSVAIPLIVWYKLVPALNKKFGEEMGSVVGVIAGLFIPILSFVTAFGLLCENIGDYVAPLAYLIGK